MNHKGFSVVELVVSFALISIIVIGMLSIALSYRGQAQLSTQKLEMQKYRMTLTREIQKDILDYGVMDMNYCQDEGVSNRNCLIITFKNEDSKKLELFNTDVTNRYIRYGGHKFSIDEYFPIPPTSLEDASIILPRDGIAFKKEDIGENNAVYEIDIPIYHVDLEDNFGIHIVAMKMLETA